MARWLLTVTAPHDLAAVTARVHAAGGRLEEHDPIPFDDGTAVVHAVGPPDLADRLRDADGVLDVHPDSEQQPY